jgi:hypothetical protein
MAIGRITGQMLSANLARSGTDLTFETNLLALDVSNSRVGIGTASPATTLHVSATDALRLPSGTTGQRPGSPANGDIRYNTTTSQLEGYVNGAYANLASGTELTDADSDTSVNVEHTSDVDEIHLRTGGDETAIFRSASTDLGVTNISNTASTITGLVTNGDITLTPNGTGDVAIPKINVAAGEIDGTTIGANSAAAGTFTNLTATTNVNIDDSGGDGEIDGCVIGGNTAAAGSFTTLSVSSNATITGDLTVNGTTTTIDSTTLTIEDPLLTLAKNNSGGAANTFDQGLFFNRGSDSNVSFIWDESADEFAFAVTSGEDGTTAGNVTIDSYANVHFNDADLNKATFDGITIEDNEILGSRSNEDIIITPAGTGNVLISKIDANSGTVDNTVIGGTTAAAGTFTTATATSVNATNVRANDGTAAIVITDSTGAVAISTAVDINGGNFTFNEGSAAVDARFESNGDTHALFIDGSEDHVGIRTSSPAYDLDISGSTDALRLPVGNTAQRPTGATGIIRFNTTTGKYEGCADGSTFINFATAGDAPTFTKESTTGDGSTTTFSGFFSSAPESANNVFVYIDNVYQEPTENYSVSGTNITFTSAPHSGARIFAITGADNSSLVTGGVARSETSSVNFTSTATTIMSFNAATYRSAELFIQLTDTANTEYAAMKAVVNHDGSTAYISIFGVTNTGSTDLGTITAEHDGSNTVNVQAVSSGGQTAAKVQYSLVAA